MAENGSAGDTGSGGAGPASPPQSRPDGDDPLNGRSQATASRRLGPRPELLARVVAWLLVVGVAAALYLMLAGAAALLRGPAAGTSAATTLPAAATVALVFPTLTARARRVTARLLLGDRPDPRDVVARFSDRVLSSGAAIEEMVRLVAEACGAEHTLVFVRAGEWLEARGVFPAGSPGLERLPADENAFPTGDWTSLLPVHHAGELIGAIAVATPGGEPLRAAEARLLADLASQAGLVLANVRLMSRLNASLRDLQAQAAELHASRRRVLVAHDDERRRLERNIHDGAQQHMVALAVKLGVAKGLVGRDAARARELVRELGAAVGECADVLSELSARTYPARLEERGLIEALGAATAPSGVRVEAAGAGRYRTDIEAAVYFACMEAVSNATKHAPGSEVVVRIVDDGTALLLTVSDDGPGFDGSGVTPGLGLGSMADRLAAVGGRLDVRSAPGAGTTVVGRVPLSASERRS